MELSGIYHIAFCVNDNYVKFICVTIRSLIETQKNKELFFHILTDWISDKSRHRLKETIGPMNTNIHLEIHIVDDCSLLNLSRGIWPKHAWYRILIPQLLPEINKILYLDADTIVNEDLSFLFSINMENCGIAGVLDYKYKEHSKRIGLPNEKYLCSGILLMNLDYWRKNHITSKIINWATINTSIIKFPDQDSINWICNERKKVLPLKYGILMNHFQYEPLIKDFPNQLKEAFYHPVIIHYAGAHPWFLENNHCHANIWRYYDWLNPYHIKLGYKIKGWLKVKILLWNLLHDRDKMAYEIIEKRIKIL